MSVPKIKRDETKTKIINKDDIIKYINYYMEENTLPNYKDALLNQTKVDFDEVKDIIDAIDNRINLYNDYNNSKSNIDTLNNFYKNNINYIKLCFKELFITNNVAIQIENFLTDFLDFCVTNEENNIQNNLEFQNIFNIYKNKFDKKEFVPKIYFYNKINDIMERKNKQLDKVDASADDFFELDESGEQYSGFILTSIIMESSLVLALLLSLIMLFK